MKEKKIPKEFFIFAEQKGIDEGIVKDIYDSKLTRRENFKNIFGTKEPKEIKYNDAEEKVAKEKILVEERAVLEKMEKESIQNIKSSLTPNIEIYYKSVKEFVRMVAKGFSDSLILIGETAIGKTWCTIKTLEEEKINYVYHSGFTSPMDLYHFLYEHREGFIIFFDDTVGILSSDEALSIMLPALWSTTGVRKVSWRSTSGKLKAPKDFPLESRIIFCANFIPDNQKIKSILSRCLHYELRFSYKILVQIMYEIAKLPHPKLSKDERFAIVDFIKDNTDVSTKDFNLRTQKKIEDIYLYAKSNKKEWKELAIELVKDKIDLICMVKNLMESSKSVEEQSKEFSKFSGKGRRTFFRIKKRLKEETEDK